MIAPQAIATLCLISTGNLSSSNANVIGREGAINWRNLLLQTGMVLQRHSRRVFCRVDKGTGRGEQSDSRSTDDSGRSRGQATGPTKHLRPADVGRGETKHVVISFLADGLGA